MITCAHASRGMFEDGKPVGALGHAAAILAKVSLTNGNGDSKLLLAGRNVTGFTEKRPSRLKPIQKASHPLTESSQLRNYCASFVLKLTFQVNSYSQVH